ncbi:MAG: hypothetical protein ACJARS_002881 [bacterium]|jgi:hypothetical protein
MGLLIELGQVGNGGFTAAFTETPSTHGCARLLIRIASRRLNRNHLRPGNAVARVVTELGVWRERLALGSPVEW